MLVRCQRFGDLFLFGLVWPYSSNHKTYNKGPSIKDVGSLEGGRGVPIDDMGRYDGGRGTKNPI